MIKNDWQCRFLLSLQKTFALGIRCRIAASETRAEDRLPAPIRTGANASLELVRGVPWWTWHKPCHRQLGNSSALKSTHCTCNLFSATKQTQQQGFFSMLRWEIDHAAFHRSCEGVLLLLQEGRWSADHFVQPQRASSVRMLSRFATERVRQCTHFEHKVNNSSVMFSAYSYQTERRCIQKDILSIILYIVLNKLGRCTQWAVSCGTAPLCVLLGLRARQS